MQFFSCNLQCNADESIVRQVADHTLHTWNLPPDIGKSRKVLTFSATHNTITFHCKTNCERGSLLHM